MSGGPLARGPTPGEESLREAEKSGHRRAPNDIQPDHARALTLKAGILMGRGDYEQARHLLEQALEIDHKLPAAHFNMGFLHLRSRPHNYRKAIDNLSQAIGLKPDFANAYFYRAAAHCDIQRFEDALNDIEQAEKLRSSVGAVLFTPYQSALIKGNCHYRREEWRKAIVAYKEFLQKAPPSYRSAIKKYRARVKEVEAKVRGR